MPAAAAGAARRRRTCAALLRRALEDPERGLGGLDVTATDDALDHLVEIAGGDARMALTGLEAAALAASAAGTTEVTPRSRRRGRAAQGGGVRPPGRRALRRDLGVHQVDPGLGPRRHAVLARAHARGGGGPALHRPQDDRARVGGHRARRPAGAADRGGGGPGAGARRAARGAPEPGRGRDLPGAGAEVQQRLHGARRRRWRTPRAPTPCPTHLRDASYPGAQRLGHGEGYRYPHDYPGHVWSRSTARSGSPGDRYYEPSGEGEET